MAWAGFAKNTPDFGPVFTGMTMTASEKIRPFNDRMPFLHNRTNTSAGFTGKVAPST